MAVRYCAEGPTTEECSQLRVAARLQSLASSPYEARRDSAMLDASLVELLVSRAGGCASGGQSRAAAVPTLGHTFGNSTPGACTVGTPAGRMGSFECRAQRLALCMRRRPQPRHAWSWAAALSL